MAGACLHKWHSALDSISLVYSNECYLCGHARNDAVSHSLIFVGLLLLFRFFPKIEPVMVFTDFSS